MLKALATQYTDYGFDKLFELLKARGYIYNHKRVYRLYCELGLNIRVKPKKRLAPRTKETLEVPSQLNQCWSLDYMSDALVSGIKFRTANVIDDCSRECLGILVSFSLPTRQITHWLDHLACERGYPDKIRVDNGPENISKAFKKWAKRHSITIHYIQPGKPAQNAFIERFNRTYRQAILNQHWFNSIAEAQAITDDWLEHYNKERPHQSLGQLAPWQFAKEITNALSTFALR